MSGQLGYSKDVQKSCRFTNEEVQFILDEFGSYYQKSFNACLSNMIYGYHRYKDGIKSEMKEAEERLEQVKKEIAEHKEILTNLKRIENSVNSALYCAKDMDKVIQKK